MLPRETAGGRGPIRLVPGPHPAPELLDDPVRNETRAVLQELITENAQLTVALKRQIREWVARAALARALGNNQIAVRLLDETLRLHAWLLATIARGRKLRARLTTLTGRRRA